HHPKLLNLAINIQDAMTIDLLDKDNNNEIPLNATYSYSFIQNISEINQNVRYRLQEECKSLFLRTRNNTNALYEELIMKVCKISKSDYCISSLVKDVGGWDEEEESFTTDLLEFINEDM
ncbi:5277_t:CDS:2, partial [Scutellospora calospora]